MAPSLLRAEPIGPPDCPLMRRWTLYAGERVKVMVHHFLPGADDRDAHDHPRPFWTLVLRGGYEDLVPCSCMAPGAVRGGGPWLNDPRCGGTGWVLGDGMRAGTLRFRPARHAHRTRVGPNGAWTIVVMGPKHREWGFFRAGRWWPVREYEETFGFAFRCETDDGLPWWEDRG